MQMRKLLTIVRTITSFSAKYKPIASSTSPLLLDSYFEPNPHLDVYSKNRTIDNLIKARDLVDANKLFDEMLLRDCVTYNLLINGHGRYGMPEQAISLYSEMVFQGIRESGSTFSSVLSICADAGFYRVGIQVHCRVISLGFGMNLFIGSSLVDLYFHMGLDHAPLKLFNELPQRNLAIWNLLFRGLCELGRSDQLLGLYKRMEIDNNVQNGLTYCYLIRGCSNERLFDEGKQLHCRAVKAGWAEANLFVANALVDFYSACGSLIDARRSYEAIAVEDVISWNSIIAVYSYNGRLFDALKLFSEMQLWGKRPSVRSFVAFLNVSAGSGNILFGKQIHCYVLKIGLDEGSVHIQSALIDMYGKSGEIENSVSLFHNVAEKHLGCCNSLMTALLYCGAASDVVEMFGLTVDEGIGVDGVSLSTTLKALSFSSLTSLAGCKMLHCFGIKLALECDNAVASSLIDVYSRCGQVELSCQIFEQLPSPNSICFTSIINGYARSGMGREAINMLEAMIRTGLTPDKVTFLCVLAGCNHSGMVKEGKLVFDLMESFYGIYPEQQHYSCMVDLLGRAGLLDEAEELLLQAPAKDNCVIWSSLLRSCMVHRNEFMGRRAAKVLLDLEPEDFSVYMQVSNFFSEIGEFEYSRKIREIGMSRMISREIGSSVIEANTFNYP